MNLTDVLAQQQTVRLFGHMIHDLSPKGPLGLALDPNGPVRFAAIRAYALANRMVDLPQPVLMSVYGDGSEPAPDDIGARPHERCWTALSGDLALRMDLRKASVLGVLQPADPAAGAPWRQPQAC